MRDYEFISEKTKLFYPRPQNIHFTQDQVWIANQGRKKDLYRMLVLLCMRKDSVMDLPKRLREHPNVIEAEAVMTMDMGDLEERGMNGYVVIESNDDDCPIIWRKLVKSIPELIWYSCHYVQDINPRKKVEPQSCQALMLAQSYMAGYSGDTIYKLMNLDGVIETGVFTPARQMYAQIQAADIDSLATLTRQIVKRVPWLVGAWCCMKIHL